MIVPLVSQTTCSGMASAAGAGDGGAELDGELCGAAEDEAAVGEGGWAVASGGASAMGATARLARAKSGRRGIGHRQTTKPVGGQWALT